MKQFLHAIPVFLLILLTLESVGQQREFMVGNFNHAKFSEFVAAVEDQTPYRFFYKEIWTDSVFVTIQVRDMHVKEVLNTVLQGTELHYIIDNDRKIYITREREILSELPINFFNDNKNSVARTVEFDYSDYEKREKQRKQVETKLYNIGTNTGNLQGSATLAGNVRDADSGEPVIGAAVYVENPTIGVTTDQFGYYALTIAKGRHEIKIKSVGMKSTQRQIMLYSNGKFDIELQTDVTPLKEIVIRSEQADVHVTRVQMGMERLDIKTMKQIPLALGETDIMKVVLTLPGVQSVGEGTVGLNVRGGATNQNLILFNDAVVYNPSHLFGFFSTFNPDVLKNVELYKSGITAEYGGRLSSVLDVHSREGNVTKFSGSGGISPITGRFTLEGPLIKNRTSFVVGVRSTYSDWLLHQVNDKALQNSTASFYDVTATLSHKIDDSNNIYTSAYFSQDHFRLNSDTVYGYSDRNASIKWKHVFNSKLYGVLTSGFSRYTYDLSSDLNPVNAFKMNFAVKQFNTKADFNYFPNSNHTINAGLSTIRYNLAPGNMQPSGAESIAEEVTIQKEQGLESALYIGDNIELNEKLSFYAGFRYSFYQSIGPKESYFYDPGGPRETGNIIDTLFYDKGKIIKSYGGAEPRFSIRYSLPGNASVKLSYNRMYQYIQMLSNTTAINPTDIWKLSDQYIKPQVGDQVSLGLYKNLKGNIIETSVEAYYKSMQNVADYKGGAELLLNPALETDILAAKGKAYGIEFMIKKASGKANGWMSYTYSRSLLKTEGMFANETVNRGNYYPSNFDKPHAVNFIGNYKFSRRFNFSLNFVYSTGRPITLPLKRYDYDGVTRVFYSDRNQFRIPDYIRTDISINLEGNHKVHKLAHSSWTFAVYNLAGRANAYSVYFTTENGNIKGYKLSIFAQPIPTLTYNFKF